MFKNVAGQKIRLFAFTASTGLPKTGDAANITAYLSKDFGAVTALADTTATEEDATNSAGWYVLDVSQAESNCDVGNFTGKSTTSGVVVVGREVWPRPANFGALAIDTNGRVDVSKIEGTDATDQIRDSIVSDATRFAGANVAAIKTVTDKVDNTLESNGSGGWRIKHDALLHVAEVMFDVNSGTWHGDAVAGSVVAELKLGIAAALSSTIGIVAHLGDTLEDDGAGTWRFTTAALRNTWMTGLNDVDFPGGSAGQRLFWIDYGPLSWLGTTVEEHPVFAGTYRFTTTAVDQILADMIDVDGTTFVRQFNSYSLENAPTGSGGGGGLDAAGVRAAIGLASANLDSQLDALPTNAELATALAAADDATLARLGTPAGASIAADIAAVATTASAVKAKTDNLPSDPADASDVLASTAAIYSRIGAPAGASIAADLAAVATSAAAADVRGDKVVVRGTVSGTAPTTTTLTPSALSVTGVDADQLKGRIIIFDRDTTTVALRGQATNILASSADALPLLTFSALSRAPVSGDTFTIA